MKYFIISSLLFSSLIYVAYENCQDIAPNKDEDCVSSAEDSENYCCYASFKVGRSDYERDDDIEIVKRCFPFDHDGKEELEDGYHMNKNIKIMDI